MSEMLKEITYLTMKKVKKESIVLPADYSQIFASFANEKNFDLDDQSVVMKDLNQDLNQVDNIVKKTSQNLGSLKESTAQAQVAIENNDTESLSKINTQLEEMQNQINFLEKELFSDGLTKAYNRKWFSDYYLNDEKFPEDGYISFIDINKFKFINDNYGHLVGDLVLRYLVKFLKTELSYDGVNIVRYAGDEFLILFPKKIALQMNIQNLMLKVQTKLAAQKLKSEKIKELKFSFSFGLVEFSKNEDVSVVIEKADELMYENKSVK